MLQSNHRNVSLVHSHIAVLQFAFFLLTQKRGAQKYMIKKQPDAFRKTEAPG